MVFSPHVPRVGSHLDSHPVGADLNTLHHLERAKPSRMRPKSSVLAIDEARQYRCKFTRNGINTVKCTTKRKIRNIILWRLSGSTREMRHSQFLKRFDLDGWKGKWTITFIGWRLSRR